MRIDHDSVHLWQLALDQPDHRHEALERLLSPEERNAGRGLQFALHRERFLVFRAARRLLLARYLRISPSEVEFTVSRHGKPHLHARHGSPLRFNMARTGNIGVFAVTPGQTVGVDIEAYRPVADASVLVQRYFSPREHAAFSVVPEQDRERAFIRAWTRKEAFVKALGEGLSMPLDQFTVSMHNDGPPRVVHADSIPDVSSRWSLVNMEIADSCAGALVLEGPSAVPHVFDWDLDDI